MNSASNVNVPSVKVLKLNVHVVSESLICVCVRVCKFITKCCEVERFCSCRT